MLKIQWLLKILKNIAIIILRNLNVVFFRKLHEFPRETL
jgi:hypothetical protein